MQSIQSGGSAKTHCRRFWVNKNLKHISPFGATSLLKHSYHRKRWGVMVMLDFDMLRDYFGIKPRAVAEQRGEPAFTFLFPYRHTNQNCRSQN